MGAARSERRAQYSYWGGVTGLAIVVTLAVLLPPLDQLLEGHEGLHHLQHAVTFVFSLVAGRGSYKLMRLAASESSKWLRETSLALIIASHRFNPRGVLPLLLATGLTVFWHIPQFFNLAVLDDTVHVLEHFSFLVAGGAVGFGLQRMGMWTRLGSLLVTEIAMILFGAIVVVFQPHVYTSYPLGDEIIFGIAMLYTIMPLMVYTVYRFMVAQVS